MPISRYDFGGLVFTVTRDFARMERNFCKVAGLYQGQPRILTILKSNEGVTLSELSPLCGIGLPSLSVSLRNLQKNGQTGQSLSVSLRNLQKSGLIRKEGTGKNQKLYLTELGHQCAMIFHQEIDSFFTQYFSTLGPQGAEAFGSALQSFDKFIEDFNDQYELRHGWKKD